MVENSLTSFYITFYQTFFSFLNITKVDNITNKELNWFYMYYQIFIYDLLELYGIKKEDIDNMFIKDIRITSKECFELYGYIINFIFDKKNIKTN